MTPIDTGSDYFPEAWHDGGQVYCRLAGDLNVETVPWAKVVLQKLITDYQPNALIVDLKDVSMIDSSGLATLVMGRKQMPAAGKIVLKNPSAPVRGLISIARLDKLFDFDDADNASA